MLFWIYATKENSSSRGYQFWISKPQIFNEGFKTNIYDYDLIVNSVMFFSFLGVKTTALSAYQYHNFLMTKKHGFKQIPIQQIPQI